MIFDLKLPTVFWRHHSASDYKGGHINGLPHGKGKTVSSKDKNISLEGEFKNGKLLKGSFETPNYSFNGSFHNNLAHGQGILEQKYEEDNIRLVGTWSSGLLHGGAEIYIFDGVKMEFSQIMKANFQKNQISGNITLQQSNQTITYDKHKKKFKNLFEGLIMEKELFSRTIRKIEILENTKSAKIEYKNNDRYEGEIN